VVLGIGITAFVGLFRPLSRDARRAAGSIEALRRE